MPALYAFCLTNMSVGIDKTRDDELTRNILDSSVLRDRNIFFCSCRNHTSVLYEQYTLSDWTCTTAIDDGGTSESRNRVTGLFRTFTGGDENEEQEKKC